MLPSVAFRSFASRFRPPKLDEGFQDVTKLDFKVRELSHVRAAEYLRARGLNGKLTEPSAAFSLKATRNDERPGAVTGSELGEAWCVISGPQKLDSTSQRSISIWSSGAQQRRSINERIRPDRPRWMHASAPRHGFCIPDECNLYRMVLRRATTTPLRVENLSVQLFPGALHSRRTPYIPAVGSIPIGRMSSGRTTGEEVWGNDERQATFEARAKVRLYERQDASIACVVNMRNLDVDMPVRTWRSWVSPTITCRKLAPNAPWKHLRCGFWSSSPDSNGGQFMEVHPAWSRIGIQ